MRWQSEVAGSQSAAEAIRWLTEGMTLMRHELGTETPDFRKVIWFLFQDAQQTAAVLPDRERGWLMSGERSHWPEIARSARERFEAEVAQLTEGMAPTPIPLRKFRALDPSAVSRMLGVLDWTKYILAQTRGRSADVAMTRRNRAIFLALAGGAKPRHVRAMGGQSRSLIASIRVRSLRQVVEGLEAEHGIALRAGQFISRR